MTKQDREGLAFSALSTMFATLGVVASITYKNPDGLACFTAMLIISLAIIVSILRKEV